jgi:hypothetical protein
MGGKSKSELKRSRKLSLFRMDSPRAEERTLVTTTGTGINPRRQRSLDRAISPRNVEKEIGSDSARQYTPEGTSSLSAIRNKASERSSI